ncbi:hypothetical protein HK102_002188 [Quaeritorhiza haematococci]|nr:hypothetical protein HK102_002188 [Quaeritorhiza haematococci]
MASRASEDEGSVVISTHPPRESTCPKHYRARKFMASLVNAPSPPETRWPQFLHIPTHQLGSLSSSQIQAFYDQTPSSLDQEFSDMVKDYLGRQGLRIPRALWSSFVRFMEDVMELNKEEDGDGDGGVEELWDEDQDEEDEADERTRRQKRARTSSNSSAESVKSNDLGLILPLPRGVADLGTDKTSNGSAAERTCTSTESDQPDLDAMSEDTTTSIPNGAGGDAHKQNNDDGKQDEEQQVDEIDVDAEDSLLGKLPSDLIIPPGEEEALFDDMNTTLEDIFLEEYGNAIVSVSSAFNHRNRRGSCLDA